MTNHYRKLSHEKMLEIIERIKNGARPANMAAEYGVSRQAIFNRMKLISSDGEHTERGRGVTWLSEEQLDALVAQIQAGPPPGHHSWTVLLVRHFARREFGVLLALPRLRDFCLEHNVYSYEVTATGEPVTEDTPKVEMTARLKRKYTSLGKLRRLTGVFPANSHLVPEYETSLPTDPPVFVPAKIKTPRVKGEKVEKPVKVARTPKPAKPISGAVPKYPLPTLPGTPVASAPNPIDFLTPEALIKYQQERLQWLEKEYALQQAKLNQIGTPAEKVIEVPITGARLPKQGNRGKSGSNRILPTKAKRKR